MAQFKQRHERLFGAGESRALGWRNARLGKLLRCEVEYADAEARGGEEAEEDKHGEVETI